MSTTRFPIDLPANVWAAASARFPSAPPCSPGCPALGTMPVSVSRVVSVGLFRPPGTGPSNLRMTPLQPSGVFTIFLPGTPVILS